MGFTIANQSQQRCKKVSISDLFCIFSVNLQKKIRLLKYRGGRNQWHSRGFFNRPYDPMADNGDNDSDREFRLDYNPLSPRFHFRPNSDPAFNQNRSFQPCGQSLPPYSNPNQQFAPPPLYNQNQQFRRQGQPQPHFNPNQQFRSPPLYNQGQQQPYFDQNQQFRPQGQPPQPFGQFRQQQRLRSQPLKPLHYRYWEYAKPGPPPSRERFTVLSYNILADYLAIKHRSKLYFHIPLDILDWEFRKRNIIFELGLWSADILCFQEVDKFQDLEEDLKIRGYSGIWKMRTGVPVDGCAIFWRSSRFKLLHEEAIEFNKLGLWDNVAQICVLESLIEKFSSGSPPPACSEGRNKVVICNIHVLFNPRRGDIKLGQVRVLLDKAYATSKIWDDAPVVLCGDFNSTPKSSLYNFILEQKLNVSELPRDKISGQHSAEISPNMPFAPTVRPQSNDNSTQSPTSTDNKDVPKEEAGIKGESKSSMSSRSESARVLSDEVPDDNSLSTEELSLSHSTNDTSNAELSLGTPEVLDGSSSIDSNILADNPAYDPSAWTPMEIEAATGSSDCLTVEHHLKLRSSYSEVEDYSGTRDSNGEPQVTSYHRGFKGTVDYIWRSEGLQTVRVLAPIPIHALQLSLGFPTKRWGSDHVALVTELAFHNEVDDQKSEAR